MKCTGRVAVKEAGRIKRDADGKPVTRACKNEPIHGGKVCRMHGGSAPQVKAHAAVRAEVMNWGLGDTTLDPGEILLRLVSQSAARAQRYATELEEMVSEAPNLRSALVREAYGEFGPTGEYVRGLAQLEAQERDRCAGFAAKAVAAGLAERQVRLAEKQAEIVIKAVEAALEAAGVPVGERGPAKLAAARHLKVV